MSVRAFTDHVAAARLRDMREDAGLTQEGLAASVKRYAKDNDWYKVHGGVDAFTIRRIERDGHLPSLRVRLVLALYFKTQHRLIWEERNRAPVAQDVAA